MNGPYWVMYQESGHEAELTGPFTSDIARCGRCSGVGWLSCPVCGMEDILPCETCGMTGWLPRPEEQPAWELAKAAAARLEAEGYTINGIQCHDTREGAERWLEETRTTHRREAPEWVGLKPKSEPGA